MKIEIELPDWVDEKHIYIMAGLELAAYKEAQEGTFHIKTSRCTQCGECCKTNPKSSYYPLDEKGWCTKLVPVGTKLMCSLGIAKPLPCAFGDPIMGKWDRKREFCSIRYDNEE